jgi:polar amino acid transport system substrate-binding protein
LGFGVSFVIHFRENIMNISILGKTALALGLVLGLSTSAQAQNACAAGKTIKEGALTIATGEPAYFPWVIDNAPETGKGFEAAVAMEIATRLGFAADKVTWVRTSFDQAIQPGAKDFDFNLQQYSITAERAQVIDFSVPYYKPAQSVVVRKPTVEAGAKPTIDSLKGLKWGAVEGTTQTKFIADTIAPAAAPLMYNDVADSIEAMKAGQIDAVVMDLPSALYVSAVQIEDGAILGQFSINDGSDGMGLVFEKGKGLKACVDEALNAMAADGKLKAIETEWLESATGAAMIK